MYTRSDLYKRLWNDGARVESKIDIENSSGGFTTFGESQLFSMSTEHHIFSDDNPSVGGCCAAEIDVEIRDTEDKIASAPRMAKMKPYIRLVSGTTVSEWIPKGVFYIDTRSIDTETHRAKIHGYDSMLKTEQLYGTAAQNKTMRGAVADIASKIGVSVVGINTFSDTWEVQMDTTLTMREYLQYIASVHGGNFYFNYDGALCFKPLYCIGAAPNYERLCDENNNVLIFGDVSILVKDDERTNLVNVGRSMTSFDISPVFSAFTKVVLVVNQDSGTQTVYESGTDTGRELELSCPWGTQAMADYVLSQIQGYAYQPMESENTIVDPSVELCDGIYANGYYSGVFKLYTAFSSMATSSISAPADEEIDHEYAYSDSTTKTERKFGKVYSSIKVLNDEIELKVDSDTAQSMIDLSIDGISLGVSSSEGSSTFTITSNGVTISTQTLDITVDSANINGKLTASQIDATELKVDWANIENVSITNAQISSLEAKKITAGTISANVILQGNASLNWDALKYPSTLPVVGTGGGVQGTVADCFGVTTTFACGGNAFFASGANTYIGDKTLTAYITDTVGTVVAKFG